MHEQKRKLRYQIPKGVDTDTEQRYRYINKIINTEHPGPQIIIGDNGSYRIHGVGFFDEDIEQRIEQRLLQRLLMQQRESLEEKVLEQLGEESEEDLVQSVRAELAIQLEPPQVVREGLPPIILDVYPPALEQWMENLFSTLLFSRGTELVKSLKGLYRLKEGILFSAQIVEKVNRGMQMVLPTTGKEGRSVSVLDLFGGDEISCKYLLWMGLYTRVEYALQKVEKKSDVCWEIFLKAGKLLGINPGDHEQCLQTVNNSARLHKWLFQDRSIISIDHEMRMLLLNNSLSDELRPFLELASQALFDPNIKQTIANLLPAGEWVNRDANNSKVLTLEEKRVVRRRLKQEGVTKLYFLLHLMSDDAHRLWVIYLSERFPSPPEKNS